MGTRMLLGIGAIGETVKQAQRILMIQGCGLAKADEVFGEQTTVAVREFQAKESLAVTGVLDDKTWQTLMNCRVGPATAAYN